MRSPGTHSVNPGPGWRPAASPWRWFALILLASLVLKVCLLFTSQSYVDGDEAVIGIMAKHIMEKGARPISIYGESYMGGGAAEAYLGAISFRLLGVSSRALRAVGILESSLLLLALFLFMKKSFSGAAALVASSLLVVSPSFVQWGVKPTSGYAVGMILTILMLHGTYRALERGSVSPRLAAFLGMICGLALWNHPSSIPLIVATFAALFLIDARLPLRKEFYIFLVFFLLGTMPAVGLHRVFFQQLAHEQRAIAHPLRHFARALVRLWTHDLPLVFCPYQEQSAAIVYGKIPLYGWTFYIVFLLALGRTIWKILRGSITGASARKRLRSTEGVLLLYLASFLVFYCASSRAGVSSRYLMPVFPMVLIFISLLLGSGLRDRRWPPRFAAASAFSLLVITGLRVQIGFVHKPPEIVASGSFDEPRSGETIPETVSFLLDRNIHYVLSIDHLVEWQINFESREDIIACRLDPTIRYQPYARRIYEETALGGRPYAFIWPRARRKKNRHFRLAEDLFQRFLEKDGVRYDVRVINDELAVYYGFSRNIAASLLEPFWSGAANVWAGQYPPLSPS